MIGVPKISTVAMDRMGMEGKENVISGGIRLSAAAPKTAQHNQPNTKSLNRSNYHSYLSQMVLDMQRV